MSTTIAEITPFLLTGKHVRIEKLVELTKTWSELEMLEAVSELPNRYSAKAGVPVTNYTGLMIYCEAIKVIKSFEPLNSKQEHLVKLLQKKVLFYHEKQYENDKNRNSELHQKD